MIGMKSLTHFLAALACLWALLGSSLQAAQVSWGSEANANDRDSTGAALDATYVFALGAFAPGFAPTATNTAQWASQWTTASRVAYDPINRAVSGARYTFSTNQTPFTTSNRGWIWGYNPHSATGEWILFGSPLWLWPDASSPFNLPVTWGAISATQTVVGALRTGGIQLRTARITGAVPPRLSFALWQALYFNATERGNLAISGPEADLDQDRINNMTEFVLGTAPRTRSQVAAVILPGIGVEVILSATAQGTLLAEVSPNLTTWLPSSRLLSGSTARFTPEQPSLLAQRAFWRFRGSQP
jgi:hypothetical protein